MDVLTSLSLHTLLQSMLGTTNVDVLTSMCPLLQGIFGQRVRRRRQRLLLGHEWAAAEGHYIYRKACWPDILLPAMAAAAATRTS